MIPTDALGRLALDLNHADPLEHDDANGALRSALQSVVESGDYAAWLGRGELEGERCPLPPDADSRAVLRGLGLADEGGLLVKVNRHRERYFLTDGLWVPPAIRAFPFTDESALLLGHVQAAGYDREADVVIDPATGSGNHVIGLRGAAARLAYDVNLRAIAYVSINKLINGTPRLDIGLQDIRMGFPLHLRAVGGRVLFVINMPFALSPAPPEGRADRPRYLPLSADGGLTGAARTFAALAALAQFQRENRARERARAVVLCYTVGDRERDRWQVVDKARALFGEGNVTWRLLADQKMWRVNGVKAEPNPMSLAESLPKKAGCRYYVVDKDRDEVRAGYHRLVEQLAAEGFRDLAYGIVDIDLG